jgi:DNA-binding CsgD family transcriptional regulator
MPREILIQIIDKKLLFDFFLILVIFFAVDFINFKLTFQILGTKIRANQIWPGVLILVLYNLGGKQVLPLPVYGLVLIILLVLLIKMIGKVAVSWIRAFWASFLVFFVSGLGVLTIQTPLCSLNPVIGSFITKKPIGVAFGSVIELLFPLVALFLLSTLDISVIPPVKRKINLMDWLNLYLFGGMFFLLYSTSMHILKNLEKSSKHALIMSIFYEWFIVASLVGVYYFIYTNTRKQREYERKQHENERQQHESEQQKYQSERLVYEARIAQLERANQELTDLNDQLMAYKIEPQDAITAMQDMLKRLKDTIVSTINQQKSYIVPDNNGNPVQIYLTPREKNVLRLIATEGKSNKEIAGALDLKEGYIKNIVKKLLRKTKVADRTQLAIFALTNGLFAQNDSK